MGEYVTKILKCFGCIEGDEPIGFPSANQSGAVNKDEVVAPYLQVMARFRADIRNGMKGDKSDLAKVVSVFISVADFQAVDLPTGQSISSLRKVPIEIMPGTRHITCVLGVAFHGRVSNGTLAPNVISYDTRPTTY